MNVKIARIKLGLTQAELCRRVKVSPRTLVSVEKGNYDILTLGKMKAMAKALETDVQTLFFSEE